MPWAVGLSCGEKISVWIEELLLDVVESLVMEIKDRHSVMLHLSLEAGTPMSLFHSCNWYPQEQFDRPMVQPYSATNQLGDCLLWVLCTSLKPRYRWPNTLAIKVLVIDPHCIFLDEQRWGGVEIVAGASMNICRLSTWEQEMLWWRRVTIQHLMMMLCIVH